MPQIKKNAIYNAILTTSGLILPLITLPYITRTLGPQGIGLVNFANSFIQYFVIIASLGIPYYGIREIAKVKNNVEDRNRIFFEILIIKIASSLFVLIIYFGIIFSVAKFHDNLNYYLIGIASIVIGIFDFNWFFNAIEDFKYITIRSIFFQLLLAIACFLLIKSKGDTLIYFILPILISLLNAIVNVRYLSKFINIKMIQAKLSLKRHLQPLLFLFSIIFFTSVYNLIDTTILGFLSANENVGYYSIAAKLNKVPLSFIMVLVPVMMPRIAMEFSNKNYDEIKRLISKTLEFVILLGVPIALGMYLVAPQIIIIISGEQFAPAVSTLRIMSPISLIIGLTTSFSAQLLIPLGKEKELLYAVLIGTIVSLTLNWILIPLIKHNGAAISNLMAELVVLAACYMFTQRTIKIKIPYGELGRTILVSLPFILIVYIVKALFASNYLILITGAILSFIYYFAIQLFVLKNTILVEFKASIFNKIKS